MAIDVPHQGKCKQRMLKFQHHVDSHIQLTIKFNALISCWEINFL